MSSAETLIASAVASKPAEDLAAGLRAIGCRARVVSAIDAAAWRSRFASGSLGRSLVRGAGLLYPLWFAARLMRSEPATVVATTNPFYLPSLLVLLRRLHRWRVVPLIYDLYPDALSAAGLTRPDGFAARVGAGLNRYTFRHASAVVFIGESMAAGARQNYGEPALSRVIATGAALRDFERLRCAIPPISAGVLASYVGNLGAMHDHETLAAAIPRILKDERSSALRILIAASGSGADQLRRSCEGVGDERLQFRGPLEDAEWMTTLLKSQISVVTLSRAAEKVSVPSKAFSALAAGCAILAVAPERSDLARLVIDHDVGVVVKPGDAAGLTTAWLGLLSDPARLARYRENARSVAERFDVEVLARQWIGLLQAIGARCVPGAQV